MFASAKGCPVCNEKGDGQGTEDYAWGVPICPSCVRSLRSELGRCSVCGKILEHAQGKCTDCLEGKGPQGIQSGTAMGIYQGKWKDFIRKVKYEAQPGLLVKIGRPIAHWALNHLPPPDGVTGVPMHQERMAERGFNQAEVIASILHWQLGIPLYQGFKRILPTQSQVLLSREDRAQNLREAFHIEGNQWQGKVIWLVDDVMTTGATLEACAQTLIKGGVKEVHTFCLAAGVEKGLVPEPK